MSLIKERILKWSLLAWIILASQILSGQSLQLVGNLDWSTAVSDLWGYETGGNEYALVGLFNGFSVVDLSDPANPQEVFFTPGPTTAWRDVFTWQDRAYVISEGGDGLLIVDLSPLPGGTISNITYYTGNNWPFLTGHNLFISEGILYIFGPDYGVGGVIALDLTNPDSPTEVGLWDDFYVHDGTIQGDTLWASLIDEGQQGVLDVSDPANISLLSSWQTPGSFPHNSWISKDNRTLFVTEELSNGLLTSYNVENVLNPIRLQKIRPSISNGAVPHNVHFKDDFLFLSHYRDGLMVIDAHRPANLVMTGHYDTSSGLEGNGFNGCWGVYPDLPSGLILASDVENGLFVFSFDSARASYLEGTVRTEAAGNAPVINPKVKLIESSTNFTGNLSGQYSIGTGDAGTYSIEVSAPGFVPKIETDIVLVEGEVTLRDVLLRPFTDGIGDELREGEAFTIFPNPSARLSELRIEYQGHKQLTSLSVYSITGQKLQNLSLSVEGKRLKSMTRLPPGSYWIEAMLSDGRRLFHRQFIY